MKAFIALLAFAALLPAFTAQARPDIRGMSCQEAAGLVNQKGRVVFATGKNTYTLVVSQSYQCTTGAGGKPAFLTTPETSNGLCFIGYTCPVTREAGNGSSVIGASYSSSCSEGEVRKELHPNPITGYMEQVVTECHGGRWVEY